MKSRWAITLSFLLLAGIAGLSGCDPERNLSEDEKLLVGPVWRMNLALLNGATDSADYSLFRIEFKAKGKWESVEIDGEPGSGSWTYQKNPPKLTTLDDGTAALIEYEVINITENELRLGFSFANDEFDWQLVPE